MDLTEMDLLLRAVASPARLDLLTILLRAPADPTAPAPGTTPTELALRLGLSRNAVSHHLKILLRMRLVRYWKQGVRKFYTLSRPKEGSVRARLLGELADDLPTAAPDPPRAKGRRGARAGRPARHRDIAKSPLADVWSALTAFSNFRRILMLKALLRKGGASQGDLIRATDLDRKTVKYHTAKLLRRGLVLRGGAGITLCENPPTRLHGLVLALVSTLILGGAKRSGP